MDSTEGTMNRPIHRDNAGVWLPYRTRLAGFEIGKTKLAAFAMNAHTNNKGKGFVSAFFAAAKTAGVSTTAAASLDRNVVTATPTKYTSKNKRAGDPFA